MSGKWLSPIPVLQWRNNEQLMAWYALVQSVEGCVVGRSDVAAEIIR